MATTLGQPPSGDARRDAIHVAVIPVKNYGYTPGAKVRIIDRHSEPMEVEETSLDEFDGIIDPFDDSGGSTVWMLVNPNRVSSGVRHDWDLTPELAEDISPSGDPFCPNVCD